MKIHVLQGIENLSSAFAIRKEVFVKEQGFSLQEEFDDIDTTAVHLLLVTDKDIPAGTLRFYPVEDKWRIGRVCVKKKYRNMGYATKLVQTALREIGHRGGTEVFLHAQLHAVPVYGRCGFVQQGDPFLEDGAPHVYMSAKI